MVYFKFSLSFIMKKLERYKEEAKSIEEIIEKYDKY